MKKEFLSLVGLSLAATGVATEKPNVILIMIDDMGYHQLGCNGSTFYETPNIDSLAAEGMRFTNAYSSAAVSSPTRAAMMSGKYPARLHLTDWLNGNAEPASLTLSCPNWTKGLPESEIRLPQMMKDAGYTTSLIGKWHVSSSLKGFDEVLRNDGPQSADLCVSDCHFVEEYTDAAIEFIKRKKEENPFFLYLSHNTIHTPEIEESALVQKYAAKPGAMQGGMLNPTQGAMVERLDNEIGRLMDSVAHFGLNENTIIIFFADNGQYSPNEKRGASPLRGAKVTMWEGGFREPLIVRWKNKIAPNTTCHVPVIGHDMMPTIAELCNITPTDTAAIDGISFAKNTLQNPALAINRPYLCWHYPHYHPEAQFLGAIRKGDWKLIEKFNNSLYFKSNPFELYNLANDPKEEQNLWETNPEKAAELYQDMQNWRKEVGAQMPYLKYETVGEEHFHFHTPNTATKANMFAYQTNLTEGLRFDGQGTYLTLPAQATATYWVRIAENKSYTLKLLAKNQQAQNATITFAINGTSVDCVVPANNQWQELAVQLPTLPAGIYKAVLTNSQAALQLDKWVITDTNTPLVHDGEALDASYHEEGKISFENSAAGNPYQSITGNQSHQMQTPIVVANPDKSGINKTDSVLYLRSAQDVAKSIPGWYANNFVIKLNQAVQITEKNRFLHILHHKGAMLNQWIVYGSNNGTDYKEIGRGGCPKAQEWFDIVVDVSSVLTEITHIRIHLDGNWTGSGADRYYAPTDFYYDEIVFSNTFGARTQVVPTSLSETAVSNQHIQLYPIPTNDVLHIASVEKMEQITLYSTTGATIATESTNGNTAHTINTNQLEKGVYLLRIRMTNGTVTTQSFLKQ